MERATQEFVHAPTDLLEKTVLRQFGAQARPFVPFFRTLSLLPLLVEMILVPEGLVTQRSRRYKGTRVNQSHH